MERAMSYLSLYFKSNVRKLSVITGSNVKNNLNADNESFQIDAALTLKTFQFKPHLYNNFNFFVNFIITKKPNMYLLSH